MAENVGGEIGHAAKSVMEEVFDVLVDIVLPIVLGIAGIMSYSWLGGATAVASIMTSAGLSAGIASHLAPLVPGGIAFGIGGAFWHLGTRNKHIVVRAIGKLVGAYFLGVGGGYLIAAAMGTTTSGTLDSMVSGAQSLVGGA